MNTLLIATTNPGKLNEIKTFLAGVPIRLIGLTDVGISAKAPEDADTFEENAISKAKFYAKLSGLPTLADDGGLEIDALDGEPGVKSHRWIHGDRDNTDEELIAYTLEKMRSVPRIKRGAQLRVVLAFTMPSGVVFTAEGKIRGIIPEKPSARRTEGFPYRSLLFLPTLGKFYDNNELSDEENTHLNHRRKAVEKLKLVIDRLLTKQG